MVQADEQRGTEQKMMCFTYFFFNTSFGRIPLNSQTTPEPKKKLHFSSKHFLPSHLDCTELCSNAL